ICGSARANLGPPLVNRRDDLRQRAAVSPQAPLQTPVYRLANHQVVPWSAFKCAETRLLEVLARPDEPLGQRLWLGTWILEDLPPTGEIPSLPPDQREAARVFLAPFLDAVGCRDQAPPAPTWRCEPTLVPVLKNLMFSKVLSFHFDLATSHNLGIMLALTALHAEARYGVVPEWVWHTLGRMFMHGGGMGFLLGDQARDRRETLATPAFGRWILGLTEV
ncbi:MAG: hypothetical protein JWM80_2227, partial [Cyanobacteria bacterium RYN_339]|nr:hypothetical protein [Cyanobacteria bacterium RYN_339]